MPKNQKGFINFLVLLGVTIIIFGGIGYWAYKDKQTKPDTNDIISEITNQKPSYIYPSNSLVKPEIDVNKTGNNIIITDRTYKYQVTFPNDWYYTTGNPNQIYNYNTQTSKQTEFNPDSDKNKIKIEIWTDVYPSVDTLEKYVRLKENNSLSQGLKLKTDYKSINVDNQKALEVTEDFGMPIFQTKLIYVQNPYTKNFHTITIGPHYNNIIEETDKILSTFKFTN